MESLSTVEDWFSAQCDGDWEHSYGICIETLDNPGWSVKVDLCATPLESKSFNPIVIDRTESDWLRCQVTAGTFLGAGGPKNLREILSLFTDWMKETA